MATTSRLALLAVWHGSEHMMGLVTYVRAMRNGAWFAWMDIKKIES